MAKRKKKGRRQKIVSALADRRRWIQLVLGIAIYVFVSYYQISLWWVVAAGSAIGIIWGKVFCRWMCPVGIVMEMIMKMSPSQEFRQMYQYHKIGCPIAWISGWLNKFSIYKIQLNSDTCTACGKCDDACYLPAIDGQKYSLYKTGMVDPGEDFSCSKCLICVAKCPNGSLKFKPVFSLMK